MSETFTQRAIDLVEELGLNEAGRVPTVTPLTGGVASDIARVDLGRRQVCVKFALPKLRVAAEWHAPVHRNAAEYAWLKFAAEVAPKSAVAVLGRSERLHGFAMEFMDGPDVYLWKAALLKEGPDHGEAHATGELMGRLHAASTDAGFNAGPFQNRVDFQSLRIEPYLQHTAKAHPGLATPLRAMSDALFDRQTVLIHGDASPKNILLRGGKPVLLDAECATMGDPAFDPAFCMNHLLLKALHLPAARTRYLSNATELWDAYASHICWEDPAALEARVCALLPMLFLARVDGKSPVEYLAPQEQAEVRRIAPALILDPPRRLTDLVAHLTDALEDTPG